MQYECFLIQDTGKTKEHSPVYKRLDTGEEVTSDEAPIGAIVFWNNLLTIKLPKTKDHSEAVWFAPMAFGLKSWTLTGIPPRITLGQSVFFDRPTGWHGIVQDGVIKDAN